MFLLLFGTLALAWCIRFSIQYYKRWNGLPSGPYGVPFFGYLPFLKPDVGKQFLQLSKEYGHVFSLEFGVNAVVVLNNWKVIKETLTKDEVLGRPPHGLISPVRKDKSIMSLFESSGPIWSEQRRFVVHTFRDLGFGKHGMEQRIQNEIHDFMAVVEATDGKPCTLNETLLSSVSNTITNFIAGHGLDYTDSRRKNLDYAIGFVTSSFQTIVARTFPAVATFCIKYRLFNFGQLKDQFDYLYNFISAEVDLHRNQNSDDYIGTFLDKMNEMTDKRSSFTREHLVENSRFLFLAGSETTASSISWILLILADHPDVQQKVFEEVDNVIGKDATPAWSHRAQMHYTQAVVLEVMRWRPVVILPPPRSTLADVDIGGYRVPKNTTIFSNFWAITRDPSLWTNPEAFDPSRFLKGDTVVKPDAYDQFSYGKRNCPGEVMAQYEMFLYTVSLVQKYVVKPPPGQNIRYDAKYGVVVQPKYPTVCFEKRLQ